jgi:hypothetical protein
MITAREVQLVQTFVISTKRARYADFLSSPKRRSKFLQQLYHFADFDPAVEVQLDRPNDSPDGLVKELRRRGAADDCYVISVDKNLDGKIQALEAVIHEVYGLAEGTIVCCVPGKLAYYEGEAPKNHHILHRRSSV